MATTHYPSAMAGQEPKLFCAQLEHGVKDGQFAVYGWARRLGIAALEDKIVQHAVGTVLIMIPTQSASSASCVLRPGRNPYEKPRKSSS